MKKFGVSFLLATYVAFVLAGAFLVNENTLKAQTVVPPITIQSSIAHSPLSTWERSFTTYH